MGFQDHFSREAQAYARFRPLYPAALFDWLSGAVAGHDLAWDAGTGSGQAAVALSERFARVIGTEPSAAQLAGARRHPRVEYRTEQAEHASLESGSVDLVTVAQALHWFDRPAFFSQACRVLKPGGVLAVWCYGVFSVEPSVDAIVSHYYHDVVGPYWPPQRGLIEAGYAGIDLPFPLLYPPRFEMAVDWSLDALVGYLGTWSATQRYKEDKAADPVPAVRARIGKAWGDPGTARRIVWPLKVKACRLPSG